MKLLIRNLSRTTTEQEIKNMFDTFGRIQSCSLVIDEKTGDSKGFGFIEMPMIGEAKAAMKALNGKEINGNKIRVKKAVLKAELVEKEGVDKNSGIKPDKKITDQASVESIWKKATKK